MKSDAGSALAIHAEGLGKSYRIGRGVRATTLAERIATTLRHPFGTGHGELFWALRDAWASSAATAPARARCSSS